MAGNIVETLTAAFRDDDLEMLVLADIVERADQLDSYRSAGLRASHFRHPIHNLIWTTIEELEREGISPDPPNIRRKMLKAETFDEGLAKFLYTTLAGLGVPRQPANNITAHVKRLDQLARCRRVSREFDSQLSQLASDPTRIDADFNASVTSCLPKVHTEMMGFKTGLDLSTETTSTVPWVAPPFVAKGAITELTGKVKAAGKTTLALHLARCVVTGETFLGESTMRGPVLYLTEESTTTFRQGLKRAGLLSEKDFYFGSFWNATHHSWPAIVASAEQWGHAVGAHLLVVDTFAHFAGLRGESENNAGDALAALEPLQRLAATSAMGIVVVRHERKSGGEVGSAGRGSSAFAGGVDVLLNLAQPAGSGGGTTRVLSSLSRFSETPAKLSIERISAAATEDDAVAGESHGIYRVIGYDGRATSARVSRLLLTELPRSPEDAETLEQFLDRQPSLARTNVQRTMRRLVSTKEICRIGKGQKGNPYRFFIASPPVRKDAATVSPSRAAESSA